MKTKELKDLIDKEIQWIYANPHDSEEFMRGVVMGLIQAKWIIEGKPHRVYKSQKH